MSNRPNDQKRWEELNALVDGELDSSRVADIAAWIADDQDAAKAFATLAALKATTARIAKTDSRRPAHLRRPTIAAAAALVLAATVAGLLSHLLQAPEPRSLEVAALAPQTLGLTDDVTIGGIRLPNLEPGGLRLARVGVSQDAGAPRLEAEYVGERGCRARLSVSHTMGTAPLTTDAMPAQTVQWRVGRFVYALTSERMDPQRFASVVQIAQADTNNGSTRLAAGPSDLRTRPCLG
jgi:anti-sigma factor RsiW